MPLYYVMVAAAQGLREASKDARYPAQFDVSVSAHLNRFCELSHSRQFAEALADVEEQIAGKHNSRLYLQDGFHDPLLHFSRAEMNIAIKQPVPDSVLDQQELARPTSPGDADKVFADAFVGAEGKGFASATARRPLGRPLGDASEASYR